MLSSLVTGKVAWAIPLVLALLAGYGLTLVVARVRIRRRVRLNGFDASMAALVAIPIVGFAALVYGTALVLFLDKLFGVTLDPQQGFIIVGISGGEVCVAWLIYWAVKFLKDNKHRDGP